MELIKLILHRGSDKVVGKRWQGLEGSVAWAEENLGLLGLGLGYAVKENCFNVDEVIEHFHAGIGGVEFDVQGLSGVPVVSHPRILSAVVGRGGRGNSQAQRLADVVESMSPKIGDASLFVHLKTKDVGVLEKTVDVLEEAGLLANVFFQTYHVSHLRQINAKFVYMGWPTIEVMELMLRSDSRRSRLGIPAMLARSESMLDRLKGKYPGIGLHVNLTHDRKLICAIASGAIAVDSVMVANYNWQN